MVRARKSRSGEVHFSEPAHHGFCRFCGRQTEYAVAIETVRVFKVLKGRDAKAIPLTESMRTEAQSVANHLVTLYEQAIAGERGPYGVGLMLTAFCDVREMGGDTSVEAFRDQVERRALITEWAKHGDIFGAPRLPGTHKGAQRPSKLYCDLHYPRRSIDARRAYQRDRRFVAEYEEIIRQTWSSYAGHLRRWHIDDETLVRHAAYHMIRIIKSPTKLLDELSVIRSTVASQQESTTSHSKLIGDYYELARNSYHILRNMMKESKDWLDEMKENGITNQADVARKIGVKRQAVSAALKKQRTDKNQ